MSKFVEALKRVKPQRARPPLRRPHVGLGRPSLWMSQAGREIIRAAWRCNGVPLKWVLLTHFLGAPKPLLDCGCGPGDFAAYLSMKGFRVTGVEIDSSRVAQARAKGLTRRIYRSGGICDATHLRFLTLRSVLELVKGSGLRVDRLLPLPGWSPGLGRWRASLHAATTVARPELFATGFLVRAR